jgi:hypothetical protein
VRLRWWRAILLPDVMISRQGTLRDLPSTLRNTCRRCRCGLQAEAVSDLLQARTAAAADTALAGLRGGLGAVVADLRARVIAVLAELEVCMG